MADETLDVDRLIATCAEAWRGDGETLASGIGVVPRLATGLAKLTFAPDLMLTDGEARLVEAPVPLGPREGPPPRASGRMTYGRVFDCLWAGRRHAMVTPTQIDRWGQSNISCLGDHARPKVQLLGVRGFPGNTVCHANSMFVPAHGVRVFVDGEVDMVSGVGYRPDRWPEGARSDVVDLRLIVTDLCVMDFGGAGRAVRLVSLHPGVTVDAVAAATGFPLEVPADVPVTPDPSDAQRAIIRRLDPRDLRAGVLRRRAA